MSRVEPETRDRILEATRRLMEERRGRGVRMQDVAEAAGLSRQSVYDHFGSRAKLMVATTHYVDEARGLAERRRRFAEARSGLDLLEEYVEFWGNFIPEIYGMARALLADRETDEAAAAAWDDRMNVVYASCRRTVEALDRDGMLAPEWSLDEAADLMWTLLSVRNWESLKIECGWPQGRYVNHTHKILKRTLLKEPQVGAS